MLVYRVLTFTGYRLTPVTHTPEISAAKLATTISVKCVMRISLVWLW